MVTKFRLVEEIDTTDPEKKITYYIEVREKPLFGKERWIRNINIKGWVKWFGYGHDKQKMLNQFDDFIEDRSRFVTKIIKEYDKI
jgi:hypothetical protein